MLKKLRREFVAITMVLVGVVLALTLGMTFLSSYSAQLNMTAELLERVLYAETDPSALLGDTSGEQGADTALTIVVDVTYDGKAYPRSGSSTPVQIPSETLSAVIEEALSAPEDTGECEDYPISWMRTETSIGYRIALADTYSRDLTLQSQATSSVVIFAVSMVALFVLVWLLAGWALRPVEEAWARQRRFVSDASHELKTPLAVILANTQILTDEKDVPEDMRRWVESTADEAGQMKALVEDLLTLARADEETAAGTGEPARADVDLTALVDGCTLEFDAVAFERGCSIECELAENVHVRGDEAQLGRVVRTLVDNACKYARPGSAIRVTLSGEGHRARLSVANVGDPISPEDLRHLFERFYRTDSARERTGTGGFGLGLAIAKSLVEANGGTIAAASTPEGLTTFTVTL